MIAQTADLLLEEDLPTPAVVVDLPTVRRNIERMSEYCRTHGLGLRPHTKTHKSPYMASLQLEAGAIGLTVAKAGEAEIMSQTGDDLLVAYPALDRNRAGRLAHLARQTKLKVGVDSMLAADRLGEAAREAGSTIGILVDIDVGHHRTGLQTPEHSLALAQHVSRTAGLRLDGIMCFPGQIQAGGQRQAEQLAAVNDVLEAVIECWGYNGLKAGIVSGGSSPTAYQSHLVTQYTEIRPGTYIYNDMDLVLGGFCEERDCAARLACTVISEAVPGKFVIDAGSKTLTSDRNPWDPNDGFGRVVEYPEAKIVRLSEEHGEVDARECDRRPRLGERVTVIMNHVCPCINLHDAVWLRDQGERRLRRLMVEARGKVS